MSPDFPGKSEFVFRALIESAPDGIVIVNEEGRIVLVNAQTEKLFGYERAALLNQPIEILIPERLRGEHRFHRAGFMGAPVLRPMSAELELYGLRKDGSEFPVEISLSPIQTESGLLVSSAIRDITDRKRAQKGATGHRGPARFRSGRDGGRRGRRPDRACQLPNGATLWLQTRGIA